MFLLYRPRVFETSQSFSRVKKIEYVPFNNSEHSLFQAYLEVPDGSAEGVLAEPPLLVQKFSGFPVGRGHEQPVVEALLKLLKQVKLRTKLVSGWKRMNKCSNKMFCEFET
jgi:hypothetical protein